MTTRDPAFAVDIRAHLEQCVASHEMRVTRYELARQRQQGRHVPTDDLDRLITHNIQLENQRIDRLRTLLQAINVATF